MAIYVTWIGEGHEPSGLIAGTATALHREYGTQAHRLRLEERPAGTLDEVRRQHSSRVMLAWLSERLPEGEAKLLGVTDVDLFIPVLTFVFGEAQLGGGAAVVSLARLREPTSARLTGERLVKEAVHEVGHTFGLVHCRSNACVMARSPAIPAVDVKTVRLCDDCRARYGYLRESSYDDARTPHSHR
jgi:archaemetzincin